MSPPFVRLDMSIEHAEALGSLLDLATRIHMGQVSEILSIVETGTLQVRDEREPTFKRNATQDESDRVEDVLVDLRRALGHTSGSYFGIGHVSPEAKRGYETMKAVKKALHFHLRPDVRPHVDADGVTVRYDKGPVPMASVITE